MIPSYWLSTLFLSFFTVVFLANLTESIAGFGSTILSLTLGAHLYPMEGLVPVLVPLNVLLSAGLVFRHHEHIDRPQLLGRILPLTGVGLPIGLIVFQFAPGSTLKVAFGGVVCLLAAFELWNFCRPRGQISEPLKFWQSALFLIAGGIMQGLYASGGPFVVYWAGRALRDKRSFRSTLCALWLILNCIVVTTLAATGKITPETLKMSGMLLPAVFGGMWVGEKAHARISENHFRIGVYCLLLLAGASLILKV